MASAKSIPKALEGRKFTFRGGVHPPEHKGIAEEKAIQRVPLPPEIILPVAMHAGAPAKPIVEKKAEVERGQLVAEAGGFVSAPVHAPVSGTVTDVAPRPHQSGRMVTALLIKTDAEKTAEIIRREEAQTIPADLDIGPFAPEQIVERVKNAGIVGLGGAAFPTFIKLTRNERKPTDIVLLNGSECEPYLTADYRVMLEQPAAVIAGLRLAMKATGAPRGAIAIEDNKPDAAARLRETLRAANVPESIEVCELRTKYPQGGERSLIPAVTGRAVPVGGFPPDIGVAILNVGTAAAVAAAVAYERPLIERVLTVTGPGIANPGNLLVPVGTPLSFLIEQRGGASEAVTKVLLGGPMMGPTAANLNLPVMKGMSGVTLLERAQTKAHRTLPCIRCGRCVDICPSGLMPALLARLSQRRRAEEAASAHVLACVECGSCSYVCPSQIPLVQHIRTGKLLARQAQQKH